MSQSPSKELYEVGVLGEVKVLVSMSVVSRFQSMQQ